MPQTQFTAPPCGGVWLLQLGATESVLSGGDRCGLVVVGQFPISGTV
jgi:hypothetical protein